MCTEVTHPRDVGLGQVWALCHRVPANADRSPKDFRRAIAHVMEIGGLQFPPLAPADKVESPVPPEEADTRRAPAGSSPLSRARSLPGASLYGAFLTTARSLVVEYYYFDIDRRSEVGELQESTFEQLSTFSTRLHFFAQEVDEAERVRMRDFVLRAAGDEDEAPLLGSAVPTAMRPNYLGYSTVRAEQASAIGRTLVSPIASIWESKHNGLKVHSDVVRSQVRTAVTEHVNVFGVPLMAVGVPFMEQDGSLLRCAHVSSWICHYSAVLRGAVARRTTAHFYRAGEWKHAAGRPFPSTGISTLETVAILSNSDLPPELIDLTSLQAPRNITWADRSSLAEKVQTLRKPDLPEAEEAALERKSALKRLWVRENLSASVCRYLNSGVPVVLVRNDKGHTQVILGYLREQDGPGAPIRPEGPTPSMSDWDALLAPASREDADASSDVDRFIVADDQHGPFRVVSLARLVDQVLDDTTQVLVPLPNSLWMSGEVAEAIATRLFPTMVRNRLGRIDKWPLIASTHEGVAGYRKALERFASDLDQPASDKYTIRVYSTTGVDLKDSVARRIAFAPEIVTALGTLQLPKYVWVAEVIDRRRRRENAEDRVRAMMVLDATQLVPLSVDDETLLATVLPAFVHFPGHMYAELLGSYGGASPDVPDEDWDVATFDAYPTGRWDHDRLAAFSASRLANQTRTAVTS